MRFAFSPDQISFRDSVRGLLTRECTPALVRAAWSQGSREAKKDWSGKGATVSSAARAAERADANLWRELSALGVLTAVLREQHGGLSLDDVDMVLVMEEMGRAAVPSPVVEHTAVGLRLLEAFAGSAPAATWLDRVASGAALVTVGLARAPFVGHAGDADVIVLERADALFAVPRSEAQLTFQPSVDGARRLYRVNCELQPDMRLGQGEAARQAASLAFDRGALATAAQLVGLGQHMLDVTVEYVKTRHQFGKPIGSFQAIKHALANAHVALVMARPVVYRGAHSLKHAAAGERKVAVSMAKVYAGEAALLAARTALQCHGAIGYSTEHNLHLWMKRAWALSRAWGDAPLHRERVARVRIDASKGEAR